MRLSAVTICINYADYLAPVVQNKHHFDRWIVVTVPGDTATHALCELHGIECKDTLLLPYDGTGFNIRTRKAPLINEALDALNADGWAVVMDADVLLPRHFRERLETLPLERHCLYGVPGRRVCLDPETFDMMRYSEPWLQYLDVNTQPLGYFQLFHLQHSINRYSTNLVDRSEELDDDVFTRLFTPECRRMLPMTVLHSGPIRTNWDGRTGANYVNEDRVDRMDIPPAFFSQIRGDSNSVEVAAIVGYYPGGIAHRLATFFPHSYLIDHFQVHVSSPDPMLEADRKALRRLWESETLEAERSCHLQYLGVHSRNSIARIPDQSLDLIFITSDGISDWLLASWRYWSKKLRPRALLCGDVFGLPGRLHATSLISVYFGIPDGVTSCGLWWKRYAKPCCEIPGADAIRNSDSAELGVVLISYELTDPTGVFVSMHAIRKQWSGPIQVFHWGATTEPLRLACHVFNAELREVGALPPEVTRIGIEMLLSEASQAHTFHRAVILAPGMVVTRRVEDLTFCTANHESREGPSPLLSETVSGQPVRHRLLSADARDYAPEARSPIVVFGGDPSNWTACAWDLWCDVKTSLALKNAVEIRVPIDTAVLTLVTANTLHHFAHNWPSWKFPEGTPVVLLLCGVLITELSLPGNRQPLVIEVPRDIASTTSRLLTFAADACPRARAIFLPATAAVVPGAELWLSKHWTQYEVVLGVDSVAQNEELISGNCFRWKSFFGLIQVSFLRTVADCDHAQNMSILHLGPLLAIAARNLARSWTSVDPRRWGWTVNDEFFYIWRRLLKS